jgi:hypothetical protein
MGFKPTLVEQGSAAAQVRRKSECQNTTNSPLGYVLHKSCEEAQWIQDNTYSLIFGEVSDPVSVFSDRIAVSLPVWQHRPEFVL